MLFFRLGEGAEVLVEEGVGRLIEDIVVAWEISEGLVTDVATEREEFRREETVIETIPEGAVAGTRTFLSGISSSL